MSIEESLEMLRTEKVSDEMAKTLADGFGVLVEVITALGTPTADPRPWRPCSGSGRYRENAAQSNELEREIRNHIRCAFESHSDSITGADRRRRRYSDSAITYIGKIATEDHRAATCVEQLYRRDFIAAADVISLPEDG